MPIYDFKCQSCSSINEKIVPYGITSITCPTCGGKAEKQLSAPSGFNLKGDGFYKGNAKPPADKE